MTRMTTDRSAVQRVGLLHRRWFWPALIISFLGVHAAMWISVAFIASADPSFAIEPDYYDKAVHWDDEAAQRAQNRELGWKAEWRLGPADVLGKRELALTLRNGDGTPLAGAEVQLEAFHHARGDARLHVVLTAAGDGRYVTALKSPRAGAWELRARVSRGPHRFTSIDSLFVTRNR